LKRGQHKKNHINYVRTNYIFKQNIWYLLSAYTFIE